MCCSDGQHCCPHGTKCDVKAGRCLSTDGNAVTIPWSTKTPASTASNLVQQLNTDSVGRKRCNESSVTCPNPDTCCKSGETYGCCPLTKVTFTQLVGY